MARVLMTLTGVALLAVGLWACVTWWAAVVQFLLALLAVGLVLLGLLTLALGISELTGAKPTIPSKQLLAEENDE